MDLADRPLRTPYGQNLYVLVVALVLGSIALGLVVDTVLKSYELRTPMPWGDRATAAMEYGGKSCWQYLWSPSNEHIIFLPRVFFRIDARWFGMCDTSLVTLNLLLAFGIVLGYVGIARRELFTSRWQTMLYGFLIAAMYFNMAHAFNLSVGYMVQHWLVNAALLAFAYVHSGLAAPLAGGKALGRCVVLFALAVVAILSSGPGVVCLPLAMVVAAAFGYRWRYVVAWGCLAAVLTYAAIKINPQSASPKFSVLWTSPATSLKFYLAFLGSPYFRFHVWPADSQFWTWEGWKACGLGLLVLIVGSSLVIHELWNRRQATRYSLTHVYMILLVFGIGILCCVSRLKLGVYEGTNPKYSCTVLLAWLSIISLAIKVLGQYGALSKIHAHTAWLATFLTLVVFLVVPAHLREVRAFREWTSHVWEGASMAFSGVYAPGVVWLHHREDAFFRFLQDYMRPHHLGPFAAYPFQRGDRFADHFTVDAGYPLQGGLDTKQPLQKGIGKGVFLQGWAWDEGRKRAVKMFVFVDAGGQIVGVAHTARDRLDVATRFNAPTRLRCGFVGTAWADDPQPPITAYAVVGPGKAGLVGVK
jgi:hypothetical protein